MMIARITKKGNIGILTITGLKP